MTTYNTGNAIGSTDARDLLDNAQALDEAINSTSQTYTDRRGVQRRTLPSLQAEFPLSAANAAAAAAFATQAANEAQSAATAVGLAFNEATAAQAARTGAESARDAALIQAGIYASTSDGLAAVLDNQYFKVSGSGDVAASEYKKTPSKNLFNVATVVQDHLLMSDGSGAISAISGYGCSAFIPVTAGQQYTLSGTRGRVGLMFFSAANQANGIAGSYTGSATIPLTLTAPAGATHCVFNLYAPTSPTYSNVQFEHGAVATPYMAYGTSAAVFITNYPSASIGQRTAVLEGRSNKVEAQLTVYPNSSAGLAAVDVGGRFRVPGSGYVAQKEYLVSSPNLFNVATVVQDHLLMSDGSGAISAIADYGCSAFIPVTAGQQYTLSGTRGRIGLMFFSAANQANGIPGSYTGSATKPLTVTAPAGATHCVFNLYAPTSPTYSNVQFEQGSIATPYKYYGEIAAVEVASFASSYPVSQSAIGGLVVLGGEGDSESYIEVVRSGKTIRRFVKPWPNVSLAKSSVFNFSRDTIDDLVLRVEPDGVAPYRVMGTTIGANHGWFMYACDVPNHGKTTADIGSVWENATTQYVLLGIKDANTLYITRRNSNNQVYTGAFNWISGGANSSGFSVSSVSIAEFYPPFANRSIKCYADGIELTDLNASRRFSDSVAFVESYDILDKNTVCEWYVATGGSGLQPTGEPSISVSISYVFDHEGQLTIYADFLARKNGIALKDIMFVMGEKIQSNDGPVNYYIPKMLPVTHEGVSYDYANIASADTSAWTTRLDVTPAKCDTAGILVDRVVQLSNNYGFALGYLPVQSASISNRRSNATVKALQISNASAKCYMSAIDKGDVVINAGEYFSVIAYRNIVLRDAARTSLYAVRTNGADYLYVDWHAATTDRVPVPTDFVGRDFEIVEKSANVTVLSQVLTSNLIVSVSAAGSYGYLIIKVI